MEQQVQFVSTEPESAVATVPQKRRWLYVVSVPVALVILVWSLNYVLVQRHVGQALRSDDRNSGYSISAHYRFYLDPSTLLLDLRDMSAAAPIDLFRGLFQSAAALASAGRSFDRVILARSGTAVFVMSGEEFEKIGVELGGGQNPVFLIRTLPERLYKPSGEPAFGRWEGGMLGVLGKQMEDANEAGRRWAGGH